MSKNLSKNIGYNVVFTILPGILTLYMNSVFISNLGSDFNGLIKLFTQLVSYLNLAELGLGTASAYALYKPLAENNLEKLSIVFTTMKKIYNKIFFFVLFTGILFTPLIKFLINDFEIKKIYYIFWIICVLNTSITYLGARYSIYLTADNNYYILKLAQGSIQTLILILKIIVIIFFKNFELFLFLSFLEVISNVYMVKKIFYKKYKNLNIKVTKETDKTIGKDLFNIFWHKLAGVIVFNTDYILISKFLSLNVVTVYSNYLIIINMIQLILGIVTSPLMPIIGRINAKESIEKRFKLFKEFYSIYMYLAILISGITYFTINQFIYIWVGKNFEIEKMSLLFIIINLFVLIARKPVDIFSSTSGFFSDIHIPILEGLINFIISIVLVTRIGLNGVILGTVISNLIIIFTIKPLLFYKKVFNINSIKYLRDIVYYFIIISIILFLKNIIDKIIVFNLEINNFYNWIIYLFKEGSIFFIIATTVFYSFDINFKDSLKKIKEKKGC